MLNSKHFSLTSYLALCHYIITAYIFVLCPAPRYANTMELKLIFGFDCFMQIRGCRCHYFNSTTAAFHSFEYRNFHLKLIVELLVKTGFRKAGRKSNALNA